MKMHSLGSTGVQVSEHCLGAMMFGKWGNPDHDDCIRIVHRALDAGVNFIDTADVYSEGESEEIVGKAIAGRRDDVVLATKVHAQMGSDPNTRGNSRRWIQREVENSLRRLGTDWIDLYQVHRPDEAADVDDTLGALSDLVHPGKIRYAGSSTSPAVTSAIIGPRTMEQLDDLLAGVDVRLDADVLDRIDEIVPPGTSISGADPWQPLALSPRSRRRSSG